MFQVLIFIGLLGECGEKSCAQAFASRPSLKGAPQSDNHYPRRRGSAKRACMEVLSIIAPPDVAPAAAGAVVFFSFFTSALTAALGLGGGLALLAAMSVLFPPAAVVPVHGVAQLGSNLSRLSFLRAHARWGIVLWFLGGAAVGSILGARIVVALPESVLRLGVSVFILFSIWGPKPKSFAPGGKAFFAGGAVSSFLTMFFGATGPIVATLLSSARLERMQLVATHAACLVAQHGLKSLAFGALGFAYRDWALLIAAIVASGFLGAWAGTRLLRRLPERRFQSGFKIILTLIALYLAAVALLPGGQS